METHAFDDWELKLMMDAVCQAKCVSVAEATVIREKLLSLTSTRGRSRFARLMRVKSRNLEENVTVGAYIETMLEAMFLGRKIEFQYTEITSDMKKVLRKEGKKYHLNLYTIYWSSNNYYLIGAHDNYQGLTHYRLDRITSLQISEERAIDVTEKIGPNPVTNAILYDFAGKDIKVRKLQDGTCRASFTKMNSVTLLAWFLQYINRFKVLKPTSLQEEIIKEINCAMEKYQV